MSASGGCPSIPPRSPHLDGKDERSRTRRIPSSRPPTEDAIDPAN
ncbi:hypothetical protein BURMUCF2_A1841 [Burkholderia multivorans CF2]|nr:hypothetical protein BURMUCF2_A1841 [Burkholderia multivorans CF2]